MTTSNKLTPPDLTRCQALHREGGAFSLGPPGEWEQCTNKPLYLVTETEPGEDGLVGSMTMCAKCYAMFQWNLRGTNYKARLMVDVLREAENPSAQ